MTFPLSLGISSLLPIFCLFWLETAQLGHSTACNYYIITCHSPSQFVSLSPMKSAIFFSKNLFICLQESIGLRLLLSVPIYPITRAQNICTVSCAGKSDSSVVHPTWFLLSHSLLIIGYLENDPS